VKRENTWIGISVAPRAMPEKSVPTPPTIPATCVPCEQSSGA
jgi:hypothetical protein